MILDPAEPDAFDTIAASLRRGAVIAYPTEAVFGLGCDPMNTRAVSRILELKRRSASKGLVLIGASFAHLVQYMDWESMAQHSKTRVLESWPGPNTWVIPASTRVAALVKGEHKSVAVRVTAHETARHICMAFGAAIVSTSANAAGLPPARSTRDVQHYFGEEIDILLDAPLGGQSSPCSIRDAISNEVVRL